MPLTVQALRESIEHALGGAPALDVSRIINGAGASFLGHNWWWASNREATLTATPGDKWLELPRDFASPRTVTQPGYNYGTVRIVDPMRIQAAEEASFGMYAIAGYIAAVMERADTDDGQRPWLRMYPAPQAADTFNLLYVAQWTEVSNDDDSIPLPTFLEWIFELYVREYALGLEEGDTAGVAERLEVLRRSQEWLNARRADGKRAGTSYGAVERPHRVGYVWEGPGGS